VFFSFDRVFVTGMISGIDPVIMHPDWTQEQRYQQRIATLETQFVELQARFTAMSEQNARLLEQVATLSKNSSKKPCPLIISIPRCPR
jgi:hypothetical protein